MINAPRLLFATVSFTDVIAQWSGSGFAANKDYRWRAKLNISQQSHGDPDTSTAYIYNGLDVQVGDYFATTNNGRILKIITIESQTASNVQAIVEDDELLNILQSGDGLIPDSEAIVFQAIGGEPLLYPLPSILPAHFNRGFAEEIVSRFRWRGKHNTITVNQAGHNFVQDRSVWLNSAGVYNNSGDGVEVGTIIEVGMPSANYFRYKPVGNIISRDLVPTATVGQVLYTRTDIPGGFYTTTQPTASTQPVYIKTATKQYIQLASSTSTASGTITVNTIADRDALVADEGLQVYVKQSDPDIGVDDWSLWIYADSVWQLIQTQDTAKPKDRVKFANSTASGTGNFVLGQIEANQAVQTVSVRVISPYNAGTLTVGEIGDADRYADQDNFDMTKTGTYVSRIPVYRTEIEEGEIVVFHNSLSGTGQFEITTVLA
jgi:hypothetical protein